MKLCPCGHLVCSVLLMFSLVSFAPGISAQSRIDEIKGPKGEAVRSDDIPAGASGWAFSVGTGADTDNLRPPTYTQKLNVSAGFSAGFGYSCGSFDPFDNVQQMINAAIEKFKRLPQMFVSAAQAAVASLPAYILNKINPTLYNTVTKALDEAFQLFEINFKDCQQIEREIGLGQNPYHSLVMAGIGDRMRVEIGLNGAQQTIAEIMLTVREQGPKNGVVMSNGKRFGGEGQEPIKVTENVLTAGINLLVDRAVDDTAPFDTDAAAEHPIVAVFATPDELIEFVTDIYGSQAFRLTEQGPTESKPGYGYQKKYIELRDQTIELLQQYVWRQIDRQTFATQSMMLIPPATVDELRRLNRFAQSIAIDDQARRHAINQLQLRFDYALQALKTGLLEPNLAQSEAYEIFEREMVKLRIAMLDDIAHLNSAAFLR